MPQDDIYKYLKRRKTRASIKEIKGKFGYNSSSVNRCLAKLLERKEVKKTKTKKGSYFFCEYEVVWNG